MRRIDIDILNYRDISRGRSYIIGVKDTSYSL